MWLIDHSAGEGAATGDDGLAEWGAGQQPAGGHTNDDDDDDDQDQQGPLVDDEHRLVFLLFGGIGVAYVLGRATDPATDRLPGSPPSSG